MLRIVNEDSEKNFDFSENEYTEDEVLDIACDLIDDYAHAEFGEDNSSCKSGPLNSIALMYSTFGDYNEIDLNVECDLENLEVRYYVDDILMDTKTYSSLEDMVENFLQYLSFDGMYSECATLVDDEYADERFSDAFDAHFSNYDINDSDDEEE